MSNDHGTVDREGGGATVRFERDIAASVERVWDLLTAGISEWLAPGVIGTEPGDPVRIEFEDEIVTGAVIESVRPSRLVYSWLIEGEGRSVVEWTLRDDAGAAHVEVVHRSLPGTMGAGYGAGWHAHLDVLVAVATGSTKPDWDGRFGEVLADYLD